MPRRSAAKSDVSIDDYYAVRIGPLWSGLRQESAAFWLICIYLFFEYIRPQALYPPIDVLPWAMLFLLFAFITAVVDRDIIWVSNPANVLVLLFFFIVLLSSLFAFRPSTSFERMDIIIGWVLLYFLVINIVNTEKRFIVLLLLFFVVNLKMSQYGARDFLTGGFSAWGVSGSPGWFRDSGDLGIEMTIFVSLSTAFILALKGYWGKYKKLFFYIMPLTGLITIVATASRGAQLGMAAAGIWILFKARKVLKTAFVLGIVGLIIYAYLPEAMIEEFRVAGEDNTSLTRLELWGFGMEVLRDHPLLGVGYKNWLDYCNFMKPGGIGEYAQHCLVAHNSYVQGSAELGVIGMLCYFSLVILILVLNAQTRENAQQVDNKFIQYISHGLDCGLISYLVASFFFSVFFYPMFWMQLSMTAALNAISNGQLKQWNRSWGSDSVGGAVLKVAGKFDAKSGPGK